MMANHSSTKLCSLWHVPLALLAIVVLPGIAAANEISAEELALVRKAEQQRIRVIEQLYGSVVAVYGMDRAGGGSGVVFDPAGYALTNHHVVAAAGNEGQAGLADGKLYRWKLMGTDPGGDVAIIKLEGLDQFPVSPLGDSEQVRVGDWAMAVGNPFVLAEDQKPTVTLGIVSGVKRYQYGAGRNTLVYGNCIQVDSSINPGNSGGPLYNLAGKVIGINGRGSFKERGRVNVGLGYAISMKQIRNFIPDLLATKVAQHGTLDALFSNRTDGVICDTLNLDSPAAKAGLELGDKLVAFEGESITNANQFTNLISTLPANWPAELTFERNGKQQTIFVRLTPLPYGQEQLQPPPEEEPGKEGEKPKEAPKPMRAAKPGLKLGEPGTIGDAAQNSQNTKYVLEQWQKFSKLVDESTPAGFVIQDELRRKDKKVGDAETLLASDGRFRVTFNEYGVKYSYGFDGRKYWALLPDRELEEFTVGELLEQPLAAQAVALSQMLQKKPLEELGKTTLEGSDKSQQRPSYRLRIDHDDRPLAFVWLTLFDDEGRTDVRLSKIGQDENGNLPQVLFANWQDVGGVRLPHRRIVCEKLSETPVMEMLVVNCTPLEKVDDAAFGRPADDADDKE